MTTAQQADLTLYVIVRLAPGVHSVHGSFYDEQLAVRYAQEHGWSFTVLPITTVRDLYSPWCRDAPRPPT